MTALTKANFTNKGREFDPKIKVHRGGKDLIVDEWIQSGRDGTNIYEVMDKFNIDAGKALSRMGLGEIQAISDDVTKIGRLQDILMREKRAIEHWESLPLDIRQQFGNSRHEFAKNGSKWLQNKIKELTPKVPEVTPDVTTTTTTNTKEV